MLTTFYGIRPTVRDVRRCSRPRCHTRILETEDIHTHITDDGTLGDFHADCCPKCNHQTQGAK